MDFSIRKIHKEDYPERLLEIPDIPKELYVVGAPLPKDGLYLTIIGSRTHSSYGAAVCQKLIAGLAGTDIYIVSGLALGIDTIAHKAAISAGLKTVAFPGSGLSEKAIYPASNLRLAKEILASGGTLVSEYTPNFHATLWSFPRRNRLMAGIAQATLVIEAANKSGTLITARLALDYNRDVLAVPGPISSDTSIGTNLLIKQGATPITRSEDIVDALGIIKNKTPTVIRVSNDEQQILELLTKPLPRSELIDQLEGPMDEITSLLTALELKGIITEEFGKIRRV